MKRRKFIVVAAATPLLVSGCFPITHSLDDAIREPEYRTYTETINSALITADGKKVVFLGGDYHYIFDAPEHFADFLTSPLDDKATAEVSKFQVDRNGDVQGSLTIWLRDVTPEQIEKAKQFGFDTLANQVPFKNITLKGKRYDAKGFDMSKVDKKLLHNWYRVTVNEKTPVNVKKVFYVLTPITVAADGVLTLLSIPLWPLAMAAVGAIGVGTAAH
jgi:hypothetical protein